MLKPYHIDCLNCKWCDEQKENDVCRVDKKTIDYSNETMENFSCSAYKKGSDL